MLAALFLLTIFMVADRKHPHTQSGEQAPLCPHLKQDLTYLIHKIQTIEKDPRKHPANPAK